MYVRQCIIAFCFQCYSLAGGIGALYWDDGNLVNVTHGSVIWDWFCVTTYVLWTCYCVNLWRHSFSTCYVTLSQSRSFLHNVTKCLLRSHHAAFAEHISARFMNEPITVCLNTVWIAAYRRPRTIFIRWFSMTYAKNELICNWCCPYQFFACL